MRQYVRRHVLNIVRLDVGAAVHTREAARCTEQRQRGARTSAQFQTRVLPRRANQREKIASQDRLNMDARDQVRCHDDLRRTHGGSEGIEWVVLFEAQQHRVFVVDAGIADRQTQQESIELGLGERKCALQFDWVLSRQDHERARHRHCDAVDRDLVLLHGLQQRGLRTWGCAVDLVGQHDLSEKWAGTKLEAAASLVVEVDADDVCRNQIGGELNAFEAAIDRARKRLGEGRFTDSRDVLNQHMPAAEDRNQQEINDFVLADDHACHILPNSPNDVGQRLGFAGAERLEIHSHACPPLIFRTLILTATFWPAQPPLYRSPLVYFPEAGKDQLTAHGGANMNAEIVSIGTEILLGDILDTNAQYICSRLPALGIALYRMSQIGDNEERLKALLRDAWSRADIVFCTGGLGPTEDDVTRSAIAGVIGEEVYVDPELEAELRAGFARRGNVNMPERNLKQAWLTPSTSAIPNPHGTAPGWWSEKDGRIIVAMPGPPAEMSRMWDMEVQPRLRALSAGNVIISRTVKSVGIGEGTVDEMVSPLLKSLNPSIGVYAKADGIHLRITAKAADEAEAPALIAPIETEMRRILGSAVWGADEDSLEGAVVDMLTGCGLSLATIESCTGGLLASTLTDVPCASRVFKGGLVTYDTGVK